MLFREVRLHICRRSSRLTHPLGRVRLIDKTSGAKLLLDLPPTEGDGQVVDFAVTSNRVAVVDARRVVTVHEVPSAWDTDNPPCEKIVQISPSPSLGGKVPRAGEHSDEDEQSLGPVQQVEWVTKGGKEWLAIGGSEGVVIVQPDEYRGRSSVDLAEIVSSSKVLTTDGVSDSKANLSELTPLLRPSHPSA